MTETPAPYHADPADDDINLDELTLPNDPIEPGKLEAVYVPWPPGRERFARFVMQGGRERFATFEELTPEERETALKFIMRYAAPFIAKKPIRKPPEDAGNTDTPDIDPKPLTAMLGENQDENGTEKQNGLD